GNPVDNSGTMPGGGRVEGFTGLRQTLLDRPELFAGTLTEKLLAYGLGRRVEYYDRPAVRKILRDSRAQDYRWSSIMLGIRQSSAFRLRTAWSPSPQRAPGQMAR